MDSTGSALLCIVLHTCGSRVVNLFDEESVGALVERMMGENRSGVQGNEETTLVLRRGRGSCQNRPMAQPIVVVCPCDERLSIRFRPYPKSCSRRFQIWFDAVDG